MITRHARAVATVDLGLYWGHVIGVEEEIVVHDDNPGLDHGWADA